jgi:hypothetical protein
MLGRRGDVVGRVCVQWLGVFLLVVLEVVWDDVDGRILRVLVQSGLLRRVRQLHNDYLHESPSARIPRSHQSQITQNNTNTVVVANATK